MSNSSWKHGERTQINENTYVVCDKGKENETAEEHYHRARRENPNANILHMDVILAHPDPIGRLFQMIEEQNMRLSGRELMKHIKVVRALVERMEGNYEK